MPRLTSSERFLSEELNTGQQEQRESSFPLFDQEYKKAVEHERKKNE
jgi:hypothetical protein